MERTVVLNDKKVINMVIVGVGGQGLITLGRVLGNAAIISGTNILVSEIHGLAQRGGSVIVHVRIGEPNSPLVPLGGADIVLGLELIEVIRYLEYANHNTLFVVNNRVIRPSLPRVRVPLPQAILSKLKELGLNIITINARELAEKAGSSLSENIVMLGALMGTGILDKYIALDHVKKAIEQTLPPRWHNVNIKALELGYMEARKQIA